MNTKRTNRILLACVLVLSWSASQVSAFFAPQSAHGVPIAKSDWEGEETPPSSSFQGRTYDPQTGRFLSADIVVQDPDSLQSYNRYSYVLNNPLTLADPTGYMAERFGYTGEKNRPLTREEIEARAKAAPMVAGLAAATMTGGAAGPLFAATTSSSVMAAIGTGMTAGAAADVAAQTAEKLAGTRIEYDGTRLAGSTLIGGGIGGVLQKAGDFLARISSAAIKPSLTSEINPLVAPTTKASLAGTAPRLVGTVHAAEKLGPPSLMTNSGEAYFWSGLGRGGATTATGSARAGGGTTLEMLLEARGIKMPMWDAPNPASVAAWRDASAQFARGTSGEVRAVLGDSLRPGNIWQTVEMPALQANPNVTRIIRVNPSTGAESVIWTRP